MRRSFGVTVVGLILGGALPTRSRLCLARTEKGERRAVLLVARRTLPFAVHQFLSSNAQFSCVSVCAAEPDAAAGSQAVESIAFVDEKLPQQSAHDDG